MSKEQPVYIPTRQLRHRYGDVSHMWVERRLSEDPTFPKPVYFGERRFWALAELEAWERATAAKTRAAGTVSRSEAMTEPTKKSQAPNHGAGRFREGRRRGRLDRKQPERRQPVVFAADRHGDADAGPHHDAADAGVSDAISTAAGNPNEVPDRAHQREPAV